MDGQKRVWSISEPADGVKVLEDASFFNETEPSWITLFQGEDITDVAPDDDGVWVATANGLFHVSLGASLSDQNDDERLDFSGNAVFGGRPVDTMVRDPANNITWFNTDRGIVKLMDAGDPLNAADNAWTQWSPTQAQESLAIGPVMDIPSDGAIWLKSPLGKAVRVEDVESGNDTVTDYPLKSCHLFEEEIIEQHVRGIVMDPMGGKWILTNDNFYYFDDGGTPMDPLDDLWADGGRPDYQWIFMEIWPGADEGQWIRAFEITEYFGSSCDEELYYFHVGDVGNGFDDEWTAYNISDWTIACFHCSDLMLGAISGSTL